MKWGVTHPRVIYILRIVEFERFLVVRLPKRAKILLSNALNDYGGHNRPISSSPVDDFFLPTIQHSPCIMY